LSFGFLHDFTFFIQIISGFLPLVVLLFHRKKFNLEIVLLLTLSVLATILLLVFALLFHNNHAVFNAYVISELVCLTIYFYRIISNSYIQKLILGMAIILGGVFIWEMNRTSFLEVSLLTQIAYNITLCVLFFIASLQSNSISGSMHKTQEKYVLTLFLYSSFSLIFFFYIKELMLSRAWFIHNIVESLSKLFIAYAFWKLPKTTHF
jgi:hypothetical protein